MGKNFIIIVLGVAVVALAVIHFCPKWRYTKEDVGKVLVDDKGATNIVVEVETVVDGKTNTVIEAAPTVRHVERHPLEPEATKRLHSGPVIVSSVFEASGKAEHASYGKAIRGSYLYTTTVRASSEVVEKVEDEATGKIRVVEKRTFLQARDSISLSDLDAAVALDTLPVAQVKDWVDGACDLVDGIVGKILPAASPITKVVKKTAGAAFASLNLIDGKSARWLLGAFNVQIPENVEAFANDRVSRYVGDKLRPVRVAFQSIEGKSYIITYTQEEDGRTEKHLQVDFTHEKGEPITEPEWEILRQANVFLDSNMVPDTRCKVGDYWNVWADEVQDLFGAAGEGRAEGEIRVTRTEDTTDGDWTLRLDRTEVTFRNDSGTTSGKMEIKDGNGLVDAANKSVKSLQATATGNLRSMNKKRHALFFDFVKRVQGDSNLRFTLTTEPAAKENN